MMSGFELKKDAAYKRIKGDIISGRYSPSERLPKEKDFAKSLEIAQVTLRSALARLEEEKLIVRIPSKGTFISSSAVERTILILISNEFNRIENPQQYILPGIEIAAYEAGFKTHMIERSCLEIMSKGEFENIANKHNIYGIISMLSTFNGDEPVIGNIKKFNRPVVIPHGNPNDTRITGFASACSDNPSAWYAAASHLINAGHERIAILGGKSFREGHIREVPVNEFIAFMREHGVQCENELWGQCEFEEEQVFPLIDKWMGMTRPPTAILCYSDFFAMMAYKKLKELNLSIPQDVAVMGCCGYPGGSFLEPPLSTVDYEYNSIGKICMDILKMADEWFPEGSKGSPPRIIRKHQLIARESTNIERLEKKILANS
jgi:DNA-binding LacI/PurR family transcriptional regulator